MASCFLVLLILCLAGTSYGGPKTFQDLKRIADNLVVTSIKYGAIPAIFNPNYIKVQEADLSMEREEIVFVVMMPDGPHIYPQKIMVWHQIVNELIDDNAYVVTYCPMTGTLAAYDASMNGLNLLFDNEGRLFDGNSVLIDRNTGSLWLQELGMAIEGSLMGRGLPMLTVYWTTWGAASKVFPSAQVLDAPNGRKAYGRDPYGSYLRTGTYYDNDVTIYRMQRRDKRLHKKTPVLCFELQGVLLAIDINYVKRKGAVNFFLGPQALVAMHDTKLDVVRVFDRKVWSEPFLFVRRDGRIIDLHTRSFWDASTGTAIQGAMKGAKLKQFFGNYAMWMAWSSMNPETFVIPGPGEVPEKLLSLEPVGQAADSPQALDPLDPKALPFGAQAPQTPAGKQNPAQFSDPLDPQSLPYGATIPTMEGDAPKPLNGEEEKPKP
ncbi:MAG: DUF3179 domain-containing protein [Desulfovibrio sp.]|nr:DUF3179 domain-containing protein [Desulfovibrio sp.]